MHPSDRFEFEGFVFEPHLQRLWHPSGAAVILSPRLLMALELFVKRPGELLTKEDLLESLWPNVVVEENNLSQVVFGLRRALACDGRRFIQTVPRRGFRFVAPVNRHAGPEPGSSAAAGTPMTTEHELPHPPQVAQAEKPVTEIAAPAAPAADVARGRRALVAAGAGLVALAMAGAGWWRQRGLAGDGVVTVAVLPFKTLTSGGDEELLGIGMADSLVERLSSLSGVAVRSTSSSLRYAASGADVRHVARDLDVQWVVDGTLQRDGEHVRATARLLRAVDGSAAWSGSFDQRASSVFDLQDSIGQRLVQELAPRLRATSTSRLTLGSERGGTRQLEAYQLYLTAAWRAQGGNQNSIDRAISLLQRALEIDPQYAQAWTLLAWVHRRRLWNADGQPSQVFGDSDAALARALALVPELPSARAGRGFTRFWYEFDWPRGEQEFRAALTANPSEPSAHHGLAMLLVTRGEIDEGLDHARQARELDPMSPVLQLTEAGYLLHANRAAEAQRRIERALDLAPQQWLAHATQALWHFAVRDNSAGIAALRRSAELGTTSSRPQALLGLHLARLGQADEAHRQLELLLARHGQRYVPGTSLAAVQAALGDREAALASLERAQAERDCRLIFLTGDPAWRSLRDEPRLLTLIDRLGLKGRAPGLSTA